MNTKSKDVEAAAVKALIHLGEELRRELDPCDEEFQWHYNRHGWINVAGLPALNRIAKSVSPDDLCSLIMGITYAEKELSWVGGSVGAVSTLFRYLEEATPQSVYEPIADWVLANRGNDYIPYGTTRYHGATHAECMEYKRRKGIADAEFDAELKILTEDAQELHAALAKQRVMTARDRGSQVHEDIVSQLSKLTVAEKLTYIAADEIYSIGFYPKDISASVTSEDIQKLDDEVITQLRNKLVGKAWGPWKNLKALLVDAGATAAPPPSRWDFW